MSFVISLVGLWVQSIFSHKSQNEFLPAVGPNRFLPFLSYSAPLWSGKLDGRLSGVGYEKGFLQGIIPPFLKRDMGPNSSLPNRGSTCDGVGGGMQQPRNQVFGHYDTLLNSDNVSGPTPILYPDFKQ